MTNKVYSILYTLFYGACMFSVWLATTNRIADEAVHPLTLIGAVIGVILIIDDVYFIFFNKRRR